jgi:two-component system, NtrC family, sensor kinase
LAPSKKKPHKDEDINALNAKLQKKEEELEVLERQFSQVSEQKLDSVRELQFIKERILHIEKMASLGKMFISMANELNNLLSGIMGYAQLLRNHGECPGSLKHDLEIIYQQSQRTNIIIKGLLAFSHLQKIERELLNVHEILEYVIGLKKHYMSFDDILLLVDFAPRGPEIMGNADSLQHIFINILNNAHQALKSHKGTRKVTIRTRFKEHTFQIIFQDNGPGVPAELKDRLFEPFFSTWGEKESLGLGLATSYGIVLEHGGNMYYEDTPEGGATFIVELPLKKDIPRNAPKTLPGSRDNGKKGFHAKEGPQTQLESKEARKKILLVDDEDSILYMLSETLKTEGFDVASTVDGQKALEMLDQDDYDIIVTDVKMPGVSGIHLYWYIEKKKPHLMDRVVFITGDIIDSTTRSFLKSVDNPYLAKPFDMRKFITIIHSII